MQLVFWLFTFDISRKNESLETRVKQLEDTMTLILVKHENSQKNK